KEQTAGMYAEKLAEFGYVTVVYDASHQGESEGPPRYLEDPFARTEDVRASVDYLTTLDFVDNDRIGALGVCAGGGYTVSAARTERRIKTLATVSMVDIGALFRKGP
ncbi:dienelactone hydrolase family protein, partial [Staphylococcus aureus]